VTTVASTAQSADVLFAAFLEAVPDAIVGVEEKGSIVVVNTRA